MGQRDSLYKSLLQRIEDDRTEDNLTFLFGSEILTIASVRQIQVQFKNYSTKFLFKLSCEEGTKTFDGNIYFLHWLHGFIHP